MGSRRRRRSPREKDPFKGLEHYNFAANVFRDTAKNAHLPPSSSVDSYALALELGLPEHHLSDSEDDDDNSQGNQDQGGNSDDMGKKDNKHDLSSKGGESPKKSRKTGSRDPKKKESDKNYAPRRQFKLLTDKIVENLDALCNDNTDKKSLTYLNCKSLQRGNGDAMEIADLLWACGQTTSCNSVAFKKQIRALRDQNLVQKYQPLGDGLLASVVSIADDFNATLRPKHQFPRPDEGFAETLLPSEEYESEASTEMSQSELDEDETRDLEALEDFYEDDDRLSRGVRVPAYNRKYSHIPDHVRLGYLSLLSDFDAVHARADHYEKRNAKLIRQTDAWAQTAVEGDVDHAYSADGITTNQRSTSTQTTFTSTPVIEDWQRMMRNRKQVERLQNEEAEAKRLRQADEARRQQAADELQKQIEELRTRQAMLDQEAKRMKQAHEKESENRRALIDDLKARKFDAEAEKGETGGGGNLAGTEDETVNQPTTPAQQPVEAADEQTGTDSGMDDLIDFSGGTGDDGQSLFVQQDGREASVESDMFT